jgi:hypothetical protein
MLDWAMLDRAVPDRATLDLIRSPRRAATKERLEACLSP